MVRAGLLACEQGPCGARLLAASFPGASERSLFPVDVRRVLAYSCAAARDLHPLPIAPAMSRATIMREPNFGKSEQRPRKFTGRPNAKSNTHFPFVSRRFLRLEDREVCRPHAPDVFFRKPGDPFESLLQ